MEKRIQELDVLRILAMLFIITFHFGCEYTAAGLPCFNLLYKTINYEFGNLAVTIFIAISGGILYKKYGVIGKNNGSLKDFYLKRARSIYPPFWILSLYIPLTMIRHLLSDGNPFFLGSPFSLLFTLVGFDGYVKCYGITSYIFCGDWFVGAIILLYLLYPLLARCYSKSPVLTLLALTLLYGLQFLIPAKYDEIFSNHIATLALKFCIGFLLVQNLERLKNWRIALTSALLFLGLSFIDIPGRFKADLLGTIAAFALFAATFYIAPQVLQFKAMSKFIQILVPLSYCVFLVQHVGIVWAQIAFIKLFDKMHWDFTEWKNLALLACTTLIITLAAWILKRISDWVTERVLKFLS